LSDWTTPGDQKRIILATVQSASGKDFLGQLSGGPHLVLIADEVHRLGAPRSRQLLNDRTFGARLGLSATPERYGDPDGTTLLLDFFAGILQPVYTLADAIRDKVLTPYFYRAHAIQLDADEVDVWHQLTAEVARLNARIRANDKTPGLAQRLQRKFIQRARIIKQARAKVGLAVKVLQEHYKPGQRWLIYCDDGDQLRGVTVTLDASGFRAIPYHSDMVGDRIETLRWFAKRGGILTAIKCLDEGVDIPSVTHALILASSKNPREFVQRRGRVLRKSPGKALAFIHDAIVLPPRAGLPDEDRVERDDPFTSGELARAVEFATHADNPASATDLQQIALRAGLDWRRLSRLGVKK